MQKVSFNGLDGSGKSQQIRMLSRDFSQLFYVTRPLTEYSSRWPKLHGSEMSRWWFETVSADELTDIIIESLNKREKDQCKGKITILDRGWRMFKAVCVATWLTREKVGIQEAMVETTRRFLAKLEYEPSEFEILLVPNNEYFQSVESIKSILNFTDDVFPKHMRQRYARYQSHLQKAVRACFMDKSPFHIKVDAPILEIQNRVRAILNDKYELHLPRIGDTVLMIVGFGGLSECGKSSFAEYLRIHHGFYRLKLRYFIECVESRGEKVTPEKVAMEFLHFIKRHYYVQRFSIESLHDPYVPAFLKLMWGERFQIVYLDVDKETRCYRASLELAVDSSVACTIVDEKDKVKLDRGANTVCQIADVVFDNSSESLCENLDRFESLLF
ncbi:MAG: hypothetical protein UT32_C0013G0031 [Parcubacteria group bacterium GW2011_GWC2_39_14]|nr:MAG: hypothetical protein UT32_C0013G0031 [Parcubacteria group bacterium GW2011_GWC2_39_14]